MRRISGFLLIALLCASIFPISKAHSQSPAGLEVGQVIKNEIGQVINGWNDLGGGFFSLSSSRAMWDLKSPSGDVCCFTLFTRDDGDYALVITVPVARDTTGGVVTKEIVDVKFLTLAPTEEEVQCDPLWLTAVFSLRSSETNLVRSWFYDGKKFQSLTWMDEDGRCDGP